MKPAEDEVQIEAQFACPLIDGELCCMASSYTVYPDRIVITQRNAEGKEEAKEYDIRSVKLSGIPAGYLRF